MDGNQEKQAEQATDTLSAGILIYAWDVFGNVEKAQPWLETPNSLLGNRSPLTILKTGTLEDIYSVLYELQQIDCGSF